MKENMKISSKLKNRIIAVFVSLTLLLVMGTFSSPPTMAATSSKTIRYNTNVKPIVDSFRANFNRTLAQTIVGRAIWYMEYGNIVYGHTKYAKTGYCDCSQFVSMVYKDFGYTVTSAARKYGSVRTKVSGVYVKNGTLIGASKLKPGDIFTFKRTTYISHVAMFVGIYNGKPCFIGTTTGYPTAIGIVRGFNNWYGKQFHSVRRVLPSSAYVRGGKIVDKGPVIPAKYKMKPILRPLVLPKNLSAGF